MEGSVLVHELRKVITLVDLLRDIGLDKQLSLPKVVVLGNQSSGKSSLLQQIVGLDFLPRGSGVVTRRPLQLRMNNIPGLKAPYAEFDQIQEGGKKKRFTNFGQVRKSIDEVTDKLCGAEKIIKDVPIVLNIFSSTCPNLTIVDLPGITSIPVGKQPKNIYEVTRDMALRYVNEKRSIILCVIPANQDLSTSQALKLMRQIDPRGQRSIGCLTKIDIMNRGDDASKILKNQEIPLRYGYVGIKNRCQEDVINNVPVAQSLKSERQFFTKSPIYSTLPPDTFSTQSLTKKLTGILYQQIKSSMPEIFEEIKRKKAESQEQLQKLGPGVASTDGQMVNYAWKSISAFMRIFNNSIQGIKNSDFTGDPISSQIRQQLSNLYKEQYDEPATSQLRDKDIEKAMINFPGDNIPGFPSIDAFLALLNPLLKKLQTPAFSINNRIHEIMEHESTKIINEIMIKKFPQFNDRFTDLVRKVLERHRRELQTYLNFLLDSELSYLYTNDALYLTGQFGLTEKQKKKVDSGKIKDPLIFELRKRIDSYYKLVVRNLRDLVPKQVFNFLIVKCLKQLEFEAFQFTSDVNKLKELLNQPQQIKTRRKQCVKAIKVFEESEKRIRMDPQISKLVKNNQKQSKYYKKFGMKSPEEQQQEMQKNNEKQSRQKDLKRQQQQKKREQQLKQQQLNREKEAQKMEAQRQHQAKESRNSPSDSQGSTNSNSSKVSNDSVFSMFGTNPKNQPPTQVTLPTKEQIKQGQKVMKKAEEVGVGVTITSPNPKQKKNERNFADLFGQAKGGSQPTQQPQQPQQQPKQTTQVPPPQQPGTNPKTNGKQPEEKKQRTATFNNLFGLK